jgi:hypothetical protein
MPLLGFLGFALSIWVASWIFAWLLHVGGGSLLIVVVFHAWFDIVTNSPLGPPLLPTAMAPRSLSSGSSSLHGCETAALVSDPGRRLRWCPALVELALRAVTTVGSSNRLFVVSWTAAGQQAPR